MRALLIAGVLVALPAASSAMSVEEFLAKANALKAKGMAAMFSTDLKAVTGEFKAAGTAYRADVERARAAGRTDLGCPPPKGSVKMSSNEIMAEMNTVPPAQRASTSVRTAFYRMMAKRFPCR